MKPQFITLTKQIQKELLKVNDGAFRFNSARPAKWLQLLCINVLRHLGCQDMESSFEIETHTIDGDDFMRRLLALYDWMTDDLCIEPKMLLIGHEEYAAVMCREDSPSVGFDFQSRYRQGGSDLWRGLPVKVIPWMHGVLLI